jgi:8-oxo-dGTP diphosphatase
MTDASATPSTLGAAPAGAPAPVALAIPYKIAVLVYVFNDTGKLLLLHRRRPPNQDLYSPIGGKLEQHLGESPHACALREIEEEIGVRLTLDDIRLLGIVSERAFNGAAAPPPPSPVAANAQSAFPPQLSAHWLMFCFEVTRPLNFPAREMNEGRLEWIDPIIVPQLGIPKTDREVIWPLVAQHSRQLHPAPHNRHQEAVFCVHIDCTDAENFVVTHEHPRRSPGWQIGGR